MALTATLLQDAIVEVGAGKFGDFEKRLSNYGALQAFKENAPKLLRESQVQDIKKSVVQTEKVAALNKFTSTLIETPTCSITGTRPTSAFVTLTWAFKGFEIFDVPSQNEGNYIKRVEDLAMQFAMGWKTVFGGLDTSAVTKLETAKSTSLTASKQRYITNEAGDYLYAGNPDELLLRVPGLMQINDIQGPYEDVTNSEASSTLARINAFGVDNYYDLEGAIKRNGDFKHYLTNRVDPDTSRELHYFFPEGAVGIYNWVDFDAREGRIAGNKEWGMLKDPMFGFDWAVYSVKDCYDDTSLMTNARVYSEKHQVGAWFCYVTEYSSDTTSPIVKVITQDPV